MKVLFQELYTKFSTSNSFKTAVNGQFYSGMADQENATYPYSVYYLITDDSDWTFSEDIETVALQISIFDNHNSPGTVLDAYEYLKSLFDDCILTVSGWDFVRMHRQQMTMLRDDTMGTWHLAVDYEIELQR